jgi:hypothetical protein
MVKYAAFVPFAGVRERAKETKKVIFQRVAEFISAARFLRSRAAAASFLRLLSKSPEKRVFRQSVLE